MDHVTRLICGFCEQYDMLSPGVPVVACVSGGTDSMFLLDRLIRISDAFGFPLHAAHFNHCLRGAESDGDEEFVREYCRERGVPFHSGRGDVYSEAKRLGLGIEETARKLRYEYFASLCGQLGGGRAATAHNADDNLETVLMRIARGTGLKGLCGIPPVNGNIIRPILCLTRAQIEEESRRCGIPHREDSTNHSDDYTRNLIRHRIMPVMRDINPLVNVTEMTRLLREDEELLAESARSFLEKHRSGARLFIPPLPDLPRPVASRVVREFCGAGLSARHVDAVMDLIKSPDPSARLSLPGLKLRREYSYLIKGEEDKKTFSPRVLPLDSSVIIDELGIKVTSGRGKAQGIYNSLTNFIISWDKIDSELVLRPRRQGDTLRTPAGTRSLKKLMIDKRIPAALRGSLIVLSCGDRVLAVSGLGQAAGTAPCEGQSGLTVSITPENGDNTK